MRRRQKNTEKAHGRLTERTTRIHPLEDPFEIGFAGALTLVETERVTQTIRRGEPVGEPSRETVWHLSSLPPDALTPGEWGDWVRGEWSVETYHGKRDNAFGEDKWTVRRNSTLVTAMLLARTLGLWHVAACNPKHETVREHYQQLYAHPLRLVNFLLHPRRLAA